MKENEHYDASIKYYAKLCEKDNELNEAIDAVLFIYTPVERNWNHLKFYDKNVIKGMAKIAYERYGLEAILFIRDNTIANKKCGLLPYDANEFFRWCEIYVDAKKANPE